MSTALTASGVTPYSDQRGCIGKLESERDYSIVIKQLINLFKGDTAADIGQPKQQRRRVSAHASLHARDTPSPASRQQADSPELHAGLKGRIENVGPGKNVLVSNGDAVDDTGAREMLKLFDDTPPDPVEPMGIDPYNSGQFDRSRHWDTRFRD
mgnify:CR=1 FL=1